MKQLLRFLSVALIVAVPLMARPVYAASATLSLSPGSSSVSKGANLTVSVRVNSDEAINGVQANLSYPANLLDYVSIGNSAAFQVVAENSGGGGSVRIGRGAFTPVSGSQTVATVTFKAKTDTGTAAIGFTDGSEVTSADGSGKNILTGTSGGNYTLKAPAPAAPAAPEAPKDTTPPTIKTVTTTDVKTNSVTITWTTSEPANSEVSYGPTNGYGLVAVDPANVTEHKVVLTSPILEPGTTYHFMVKSVDPGGNAASSSDNTFKTLGANLQVTVVNQKNKPVSGAKVTLGDQKGTTGKNGQVTLKGLPLGKLVGTVEHRGKQTVVSTEVKTIDPSGKSQPVTFKIETKPSIWILILPLLLLLVLVFLLTRRGGGGLGGGLGGRIKALLPARRKTSNQTHLSANQHSQPEPSVIRPTESPRR